ncbi:aspartate/glutamate racemase family protein [Tritonibacter mobilis]|uniref:aspartate/glutamate racemase family protein n=1 Tax=Tritonibacter mobilis TaxID=379347 RepID=UPI000806BE9F|nr:aspartate/glutamate racemase family protein [Tritonibacter mobilis]GLP88511.1 Asp/Glu racemase [Tritonibacter mobilis]SDX81387.1 allantoin racemase [Tritonibacter mobilis]
MKIHLINPNSTAGMTEAIARTARAQAGPGVEVVSATARATPPSIEGYADEARAVPAMLDAILEAEAAGAVAHVIACFDDPGLDAARAVAKGPVIGLCEAALIAAGRIAKRFSVVTTLPRAVPIIEDLGDRYGCGRALCAVHAADIPVLDLEYAPVQTLPLIARKIRQTVEEDRAEAVVLGCAGMSAHLEQLGRDAGVPVIDGVGFAIRIAAGLAATGLVTAKTGAYALPRVKQSPVPQVRVAPLTR